MKVPTEHDMAQKPIVMLAPSALRDHPVDRRTQKIYVPLFVCKLQEAAKL
jgi:hypothetical protein